jgi:hypothetical protein
MMCRQAGRQAGRQACVVGTVQCKEGFFCSIMPINKMGPTLTCPFITHACMHASSKTIIIIIMLIIIIIRRRRRRRRPAEKKSNNNNKTHSIHSLLHFLFSFFLFSFLNCFFITLYEDGFQLA